MTRHPPLSSEKKIPTDEERAFDLKRRHVVALETIADTLRCVAYLATFAIIIVIASHFFHVLWDSWNAVPVYP